MAGQAPFAQECMNLITINEHNVTAQAPDRNTNFIYFDSFICSKYGISVLFCPQSR